MSLSEGKKIPPSAATLDGKEADTRSTCKISIQPLRHESQGGFNAQNKIRQIPTQQD